MISNIRRALYYNDSDAFTMFYYCFAHIILAPLKIDTWHGSNENRRGEIKSHDDVIKWKLSPRYRPFVRRVPGEFPAQRPVTRSFGGFICVGINGWINTREANDLRRYCAHYDVSVMKMLKMSRACLSCDCTWEFAIIATKMENLALSLSKLPLRLRDTSASSLIKWNIHSYYFLINK